MAIYESEYGKVFRLGTSYDMSGNTALSLVFTKPSGEALTVTPTAPATPVSGTDLDGVSYSYSASEYFEYTFVSGDLDEDGLWRVRGIYTDGSKQLRTPIVEFTVDP